MRIVNGTDIAELTKQLKKEDGAFKRQMGMLDKFVEDMPEEKKEEMHEVIDLMGQLKRRMSEASESGDSIEILKLQMEAVEIITKHGSTTTNTES